MENILSLDTETTGLYAQYDEILSLSICHAITGEKLWHKYYKPTKTDSWEDAQRVNGITPEMVKDCKEISEDALELRSLLTGSDLLVVYNAGFDIPFVINSGILISGDVIKVTDPMIDFASVYGEWDEWHGNYRWQKLITAAEYINYKWEGSAHDSFADCLASAAVWRWLHESNQDTQYQWEI